MPGAKKSLPAPIDRPLSRAYLRQFKGWSTAYPPGLSDPASLRIMENVMVSRDTGLKVRPGLRYVAFADDEGAVLEDMELVGTHEVFFLQFASIDEEVDEKRMEVAKTYLFAVRISDGVDIDDNPLSHIEFRLAVYSDDPTYPFVVKELDDLDAESNPYFDLPADPTDLWFTGDTTYVKYLQIDNKILALSDNGEEVRVFYVDATKRAIVVEKVDAPDWAVVDQPRVYVPDDAWIAGAQTTFPPFEASISTTTLLSTTTADNVYVYGVWFAYYNELGESAPSMVGRAWLQRPYSGWLENPVGGAPDPSDPRYWADQLTPRLGYDATDIETLTSFLDAYNGSALGFKVYMATWHKDDPVPVEGLLVATVEFTDKSLSDSAAVDRYGWAQITSAVGSYNVTAPLPSLATRRNYTDPTRGGQGLVAADRLVVVNDPTQPAVIRWTSNQQGEYINFTASRGGGLKTLTSGNLYVPACVKLWQNPQSVDTLTILCRGVDGMSTGYYMAPAEVTTQSESTSIMGFEETSSSPGTTSPYGCEVYNTGLYHPLDDQLMKSTAANYAIRHKSQTDLITKDWQQLELKEKIVSAEFDGRLYYIVNNPSGVELPSGCNGNEIWVLDGQAETPVWSRWLIPAVSLRKVELFGQVYMSVVKPDGIYVLDPARFHDEVVVDGELVDTQILWQIETNTQGANRAHDAWAHVQNMAITLGNWHGTINWGMRGKDVNGKVVDVSKRTTDITPAGDMPYDFDDTLQIRRNLKEWHFYASSVETDDPALIYGGGQINTVQYRYTPSTVNTGYEFGSIETFEYGRDVAGAVTSTTTDGVPLPFPDRSRP